MADQPNETTDNKTRANLAYIWSLAAILFIGYILYMFGGKMEILTLIIGLLSGTVLGGIFGVYFGGITSTKKPETNVPVTGDNTQVNVVSPAADVPTDTK